MGLGKVLNFKLDQFASYRRKLMVRTKPFLSLSPLRLSDLYADITKAAGMAPLHSS